MAYKALFVALAVIFLRPLFHWAIAVVTVFVCKHTMSEQTAKRLCGKWHGMSPKDMLRECFSTQ